MMTPPATCDSQPSLLTTRPQSCTATILVQRTTPVSVSTSTSATCTPPTLTLLSSATPWRTAASLAPGLPTTTSMPSLAHASFQEYFFWAALSLMPPGS